MGWWFYDCGFQGRLIDLARMGWCFPALKPLRVVVVVWLSCKFDLLPQEGCVVEMFGDQNDLLDLKFREVCLLTEPCTNFVIFALL